MITEPQKLKNILLMDTWEVLTEVDNQMKHVPGWVCLDWRKYLINRCVEKNAKTRKKKKSEH